MTKDEIKKTYSMRDVVEKCGFRPNRAGFISCPFHNEKTASLKIYADSFYCFGCSRSGDIFTFVMLLNDMSFHEAFVYLGGTYEHPKNRNEARQILRDAKIAERKRNEERRKQELLLEQKKQELKIKGDFLTWLVMQEKRLKPLTKAWGDVKDLLPIVESEWEELWEEVNELGHRF